jgi:hypothetical protein
MNIFSPHRADPSEHVQKKLVTAYAFRKKAKFVTSMAVLAEAPARGRTGSHRAYKKPHSKKSFPDIALGPNPRFLPRRALQVHVSLD